MNDAFLGGFLSGIVAAFVVLCLVAALSSLEKMTMTAKAKELDLTCAVVRK
jgi:hypothetical protein